MFGIFKKSRKPGESEAAGSGNAVWQTRRLAAVPRGISNPLPIFIGHADNAELWDIEGHRYVDFAAGIAVLNTGHLHPRIKAAAQQQLEHFSHACFQLTPYTTYVELAERINALAPGDTPKKTMFVSTGAEAVENALKIARSHTGRSAVIAFAGAFHGRTLMTMALTGKVVPYKAGFGPLPGEVYHLPFPIAYHGVSGDQSLQVLDNLFHADIDPRQVAAIVIEPVQGEGGFYIAPPEFMQALRQICDEHGIMLIVDEVQTGFARTGKMFAVEYSGIEPDLMTLAKGMGGGLPISAVTGKASIMDAPQPGGLGGTFAGSPVACAAALAVLDVIRDESLCERALAIGNLLLTRLLQLRNEPHLAAVIGDVRALGAMVGLELVHDGDPQRPNPELTRMLVLECARRGVLILAGGLRANVIRFLPPLTISDDLLNEGLDTVTTALGELVNADTPAT